MTNTRNTNIDMSVNLNDIDSPPLVTYRVTMGWDYNTQEI